MRLYQPFHRLIFILVAAVALVGCGSPQIQPDQVQVTLVADGVTQQATVPSGTTAREAFELQGVEIDLLDRGDPPLFTVLSNGDQAVLIRVVEEFDIQESVIPYETQLLRNESLPEGERRLVQPGVNGLLETTYRIVYEDGAEISSSPVKTAIVTEAVPEVVMVGSQTPFAAAPINGKLAYISGGNAWVMEENTGIRTPLVTTGDLDGRIFSLSPDGIWLLYTRSDPAEDIINTLWVTRIDGEIELDIDLEIANVIHFAEWVPDSVNGVVFSTAEQNPSPPGWQANNDLQFLNFSSNGWVSRPRLSIPSSSGGVYGWWGTDFAWSADGEQLAYTRPDGVGLIDFDREILQSLYDLIPLQTRSDWAWASDISWAPDNSFIYMVDHVAQPGVASIAESALFDLSVIPLVGGAPVSVVQEVGMFASPVTSPIYLLPSGQSGFLVAYLHTLNPTQSRTSGYKLAVMDRDGSNRRFLFPPEGAAGLNPQKLLWSPWVENPYLPKIALVYEGNLWLVDISTGDAQQITGDGLTTNIDWK